MSYLNYIVDQFLKNSTRVYLIFANVLLVVFGIWFSNVGVLPFKTMGDFTFFILLTLALAIYRPTWTFLFFVGTVMLETVSLAPDSLGITVRPYQLFGAVTLVAIIIKIATRRMHFELPKWRWIDGVAVAFAIGGFASALFSVSKGAAFKQSVVALSFVALYFLARIFVQSWDDLKRIAPFFLSSSFVVVLYGILQNILFIAGRNSFEVMPGRPNGTFSEADWYGLFLTFVLATIYTINYKFQITNHKQISNISAFIFLLFLYISLILTVSRSAWLGAIIVTLGFLKVVLFRKSHPELAIKPFKRFLAVFKNPDWSGFFRALSFVAGTFIIGVGIVYVCKLTTFQLGSRAVSTGGLQKITIACEAGSTASVPSNIATAEELAQYGCRHINLEDISNEKSKGLEILEVNRPDPNVGIRAKIYRTSWEQIKKHPVFGIGWGNIGDILGRDERGAALNASNIFLETWLGAGILGFFSLIILFGYIFIAGIGKWFSDSNKIVSVFVLLSLFAVIIPNLFNSGIFLGFVWLCLGIAASLLKGKI